MEYEPCAGGFYYDAVDGDILNANRGGDLQDTEFAETPDRLDHNVLCGYLDENGKPRSRCSTVTTRRST